ncbi:hypothetical protein CP49_35660 [Bradyrhizobium valentinum]|uniref:Uncharacterized protein n=1 Tax=Bradyrhizobium valentinum TaxID=1518501 RepID=A0A0R3KTJ3_9BRAD|nr:hypothetical protein CP49_35660 [Bradyrhizobium valentinum]
MMTQPPAFIPRRRWKVILAAYLVGLLICELLLLLSAYQSGGFDRPHSLADLAIIGSYHLATGLLWPVVLIVFILQLSGLLPQPIQF